MEEKEVKGAGNVYSYRVSEMVFQSHPFQTSPSSPLTPFPAIHAERVGQEL